MKTMETTEEVSSDGMEKRVERRKCQRIAPFAREKLRVDGKKDLQICGAGRKSEKSPTLIVGKQSNVKSRFEPSHWRYSVGGCYAVGVAPGNTPEQGMYRNFRVHYIKNN